MTQFGQEETGQLAQDDHNLSEDLHRFNQQQLLTLQLILENKYLKQEAEIVSQCTVPARREREAEKIRRKEARETSRRQKVVTIAHRINAKKAINLDDLLEDITEMEMTDGRASEHDHRGTWLKNAHLLSP